ncbi:MAG: hypothetical protein UT11_C0057G0010, partial [Berkelbacteria bacterium GW2011_GWA2_38_9]
MRKIYREEKIVEGRMGMILYVEELPVTRMPQGFRPRNWNPKLGDKERALWADLVTAGFPDLFGKSSTKVDPLRLIRQITFSKDFNPDGFYFICCEGDDAPVASAFMVSGLFGAQLHWVVVRPEYQHTGDRFGRVVTNLVLYQASRLGFNPVVLELETRNTEASVPAVKMFSGFFGFEPYLRENHEAADRSVWQEFIQRFDLGINIPT